MTTTLSVFRPLPQASGRTGSRPMRRPNDVICAGTPRPDSSSSAPDGGRGQSANRVIACNLPSAATGLPKVVAPPLAAVRRRPQWNTRIPRVGEEDTEGAAASTCSQNVSALRQLRPGGGRSSSGYRRPPRGYQQAGRATSCTSSGEAYPETPAVSSSSSSKNASSTGAGECGPFQPFPWRPVQVKEHFQTWHALTPYFHGTYVDTLSLDLNVQGGDPQSISLSHGLFRPAGSGHHERPRCWLVGEQLVVCKGIVYGICPQSHDPDSGRNARVARLPEGMRPSTPLVFAALVHTPPNGAHLVTLVVTPDGWIVGVGRQEQEGYLDLSAVRFCVGRSLSLLDNVRLFLCDVGGTRYVCLQGDLEDKHFRTQSAKPLVSLPESCHAPCENFFVTAGSRAGSFHLLSLQPGGKARDKLRAVGAEVQWHDSTLSHDNIHLSGILFKAAPQALQHAAFAETWAPEISVVFLKEFQKRLINRFGSIEKSWSEVFDTDRSGEINLTEFSNGCKAAGYLGNTARLWSLLDDDGSGSISMVELLAGSEIVD